MLDSPTSENLLKKEKEAAQKAKNNEVKNLEFVKVDVDNNMVLSISHFLSHRCMI